MAAYRRVYDSHHLQADCQEPESAPGTLRSVIEYGLPLSFSLASDMLAVLHARRYAVAECMLWRCLSVCLSVYHKPVLYQNGLTD